MLELVPPRLPATFPSPIPVSEIPFSWRWKEGQVFGKKPFKKHWAGGVNRDKAQENGGKQY